MISFERLGRIYINAKQRLRFRPRTALVFRSMIDLNKIKQALRAKKLERCGFENTVLAIHPETRKRNPPVMMENPATRYWTLRYTLNAEVAEYLIICSGIRRRIVVLAPRTVKMVIRPIRELISANMPMTSAP